MRIALYLALFATAIGANGAEAPSRQISNGIVTAQIYLPGEQGYYRGTRFDHTGVIHSLIFQGHEYFGEWQKSSDPYLHDRITGPVNEFRTNSKGLGYDEAAPGGRFVRIGVGVCEKPREKDYRWMHTYRVVDPGSMTIDTGETAIEFIHEVAPESANGYGYRYVKRVELTAGKPELVLRHSLRNTGTKPIETSVYNHNFFVMDAQPTGPDFVVRFPFEPRADRDFKGIAAVQGRELVFLQEMPPRANVISLLNGYAQTASDHRFEIENRKTKAGVRMSTDRPMSKLQFWAPRTTLCPEPYIDLRIAPGGEETWTIRYEFYTLE